MCVSRPRALETSPLASELPFGAPPQGHAGVKGQIWSVRYEKPVCPSAHIQLRINMRFLQICSNKTDFKSNIERIDEVKTSSCEFTHPSQNSKRHRILKRHKCCRMRYTVLSLTSRRSAFLWWVCLVNCQERLIRERAHSSEDPAGDPQTRRVRKLSTNSR